jgi:class 3 adenylate cyclase
MGARAKMMRIRTIAMSMKPKPDVEVFYSYSHRDEALRDELERHLSILRHQGVITAWHDRKIGAGMEWAGQIDTHLNTAHVILLLISSDFLASKYCYDIEMRRAMERHEAGEARVIPIILRPVSWRGAPFEKLQALPKNAKPVTSWGNQDEAFVSIAEGIRGVVEELLKALRPCEEKSGITERIPANFQNTQSGRARRGDGEAMANQMLVSCFTNLRDSTRLIQELGQNNYNQVLTDHFSIGQVLTKLAGGEYIKNTGDGNMVLFKSGEPAIRFASWLQEFYAERRCLKRPPLRFGIGMSLGQVERTEADAFGPGVNQAARLERYAQAGQIIIDKSIITSLRSQWGEKNVSYILMLLESMNWRG